MKDLFGEEIIETKEEIVESEPKWLFIFLDDIRRFKRGILTEENESKYNPYMINRYLFMDNNSINCLHANEMNMRYFLPKKMQYDYLLNSIRKCSNSFVKYIKVSKEEYLDIIKEYFGYSMAKAKEVAKILTDDDIAYMQMRLNKGGSNVKKHKTK